jgi:hypothetical protein
VLSSRARQPALLALLLLTAGCLSGVSGDTTPSPTETELPTVTQTGTTATATETPWDHRSASNQPDPDKAVTLKNRWTERVEMQVRVVRDATNETVHDETYTLSPGAGRTVYDISEADPAGVESFTVVVTARNTTERVSIETSACYGNAYAEIQDDGTMYVYYAIC